MRMRDRRQAIALLALLLSGAVQTRADQPKAALRVAAAANLNGAFTAIAAAYRQKTGAPVELVLGASGQLAKQIEHGAPYDLFASADEGFVAELDRQRLILPDTRRVYAQGRIGIWTRADGPPLPRDAAGLADNRYGRIAIANPKLAPYGRAAQQALEAAGVWNSVRPRLVYGENVEQTFQYARSGNADAALIPRSLATGAGGRFLLIPDRMHRPIRQAFAVVRSTPRPADARRFASFVCGPTGRAILQRYGFSIPGPPRAAGSGGHRSRHG